MTISAIAVNTTPMATRAAVPAPTAGDVTSAFVRTWERTDRPVADQLVDRTWMWGPQPLFSPLEEPYADAPGGKRWVLYYDKARMELPDPQIDPTAAWYITNGLIARELITGEMQTGDSTFDWHGPANQNVAGDLQDPNAPTYASFTNLLDVPPHADQEPITERLLRDGSIQRDAALAAFGAVYGMRMQAGAVQRQIASPFWNFMTSSGAVYVDGAMRHDLLFEDPYYATGYPLTEPYWVQVQVAGQPQNVLVQCFERRCLTWTPSNPEGFQTESANVGQHYAAWRYGTPPSDDPPPSVSSDTCLTTGSRVVKVRDGDELREAIANARPGDSIRLANGTYTGQFQIHRSGTAAAPITLCGSRDAVLKGETVKTGYGILLEADYWHIEGVTIHHFLKGIEAHGTTGTTLRGLRIYDIGQEGIHLRDASSNNIVDWNIITDTGRHRPQWGEGIYIGSDSSQWCDNVGNLGSCTPDRSDGNVIQLNTIGPGVTAELIDIKEGTSGGTVRANTLNGSNGYDDSIDALISIKGNDWLIVGNTGSLAPVHGMRVNTDELAGWGTGNVFIDNTLDVGSDGYGFRVPLGSDGAPLDNTVACANTVTNAGAGFANIPCMPDVSVP